MDGPTLISVIIPAFECSRTLALVLRGLFSSSFQQFECIVVDDGPQPDLYSLLEGLPIRHIRLPERRGPAFARNRGAESARGEILLFLDADVRPLPDTLGKIADFFSVHPEVAAVFGSYDDEPTEIGFYSQFKNLFHHYTHQNSSAQARTFWAGCGAVRQESFIRVGGFDEKRYTHPAVEDIELGYRLNRSGFKIALQKDIQGTHLKEWSCWSLVKSDFLDRALPWTELLLEQKSMERDLNLCFTARLSAVGVLLSLICMAMSWFHLLFAVVGGGLVTVVLAANLPLYGFFREKRGMVFAMQATPMHLFYLLYSIMAFALGVMLFWKNTLTLEEQPGKTPSREPFRTAFVFPEEGDCPAPKGTLIPQNLNSE
jgi:glycosyltransferase involved in cell wall biosynthesis